MVTTRQSHSPEAGPPPGGSGAGPSGARDQQDHDAPGATRRLRLTGRGAVLLIFVLCVLGTYVAEVSHWTPAGGVAYVVACALASWYVKPGHLLTTVVTPPLLFAIAVICVKAAAAAGTVLTATTEGTLLTLGNDALWLFAGTVLALVIASARGLRTDIRELRAGLRGDPGAR